MYYAVPKESNPLNKIVFILVIIVGIGFLYVSYETDSLGKFAHLVAEAQPGMVLVPLLEDSYGGACSPNLNHGDKQTVIAQDDPRGCVEGAFGGDKQAYLRFDSSEVPTDFTKATMFLKVSTDNQRGKFEVYSVHLPWKENEVRWNGPENDIYWFVAGLGPRDMSSFSTVFSIDNPHEYVTVDVTRHVKYWSDKNRNYGIMIKASEGSIEFLSKESDEPAFILVK